jgi:hypothetical protein
LTCVICIKKFEKKSFEKKNLKIKKLFYKKRKKRKKRMADLGVAELPPWALAGGLATLKENTGWPKPPPIAKYP